MAKREIFIHNGKTVVVKVEQCYPDCPNYDSIHGFYGCDHPSTSWEDKEKFEDDRELCDSIPSFCPLNEYEVREGEISEEDYDKQRIVLEENNGE
jgi:hypothetical protein